MLHSLQLLCLLLQCLDIHTNLVPRPNPNRDQVNVDKTKTYPKLPPPPMRTFNQKKNPPWRTKEKLAPPKQKYADNEVLDDFFSPMNTKNSDFCADMGTHSIDYPVLPWWYNYCLDVMEHGKSKLSEKVDPEAVDRYMTAELEGYQRPEI